MIGPAGIRRQGLPAEKASFAASRARQTSAHRRPTHAHAAFPRRRENGQPLAAHGFRMEPSPSGGETALALRTRPTVHLTFPLRGGNGTHRKLQLSRGLDLSPQAGKRPSPEILPLPRTRSPVGRRLPAVPLFLQEARRGRFFFPLLPGPMPPLLRRRRTGTEGKVNWPSQGRDNLHESLLTPLRVNVIQTGNGMLLLFITCPNGYAPFMLTVCNAPGAIPGDETEKVRGSLVRPGFPAALLPI